MALNVGAIYADFVVRYDKAVADVQKAVKGIKGEVEKLKDSANKVSESFGNWQLQMRRAGADIDKVVPRGMRTELNRLTLAIAGLGAAMLGVTAKSITMYAELERVQAAFTVLLGSSMRATKMLQDLQKFAAATPFEFPQLVDGTKRLLAFGFAAKDTMKMLETIGDAAAALGTGAEGIDRMILALGQMHAKSKVAGEEIRQLAEAGVPVYDILREKLGKSATEVFQMVRKRMVDADQGIRMILEGMAERFAGTMEIQAQTLYGLWINTKDNIGIIMREFGDELAKALDLKRILGDVMEYLQNFTTAVREIGLREALLNLVPPGLITAVYALAGAIGGVLVVKMAALYASLQMVLGSIAPWMLVLTAALTALGAITGMAAVKSRDHASAMWLEGKMAESNAERLEKLKKRYELYQEQLTRAKRGTDEYRLAQERLNEVVGELQRRIPGVQAYYDAEGNARRADMSLVDAQIAKDRAFYSLRKRLRIADLRDQAATLKKQIDALERDTRAFDKYSRQAHGGFFVAKGNLNWGQYWKLMLERLKHPGMTAEEIAQEIAQYSAKALEGAYQEYQDLQQQIAILEGRALPEPERTPVPQEPGGGGAAPKKRTKADVLADLDREVTAINQLAAAYANQGVEYNKNAELASAYSSALKELADILQENFGTDAKVQEIVGKLRNVQAALKAAADLEDLKRKLASDLQSIKDALVQTGLEIEQRLGELGKFEWDVTAAATPKALQDLRKIQQSILETEQRLATKGRAANLVAADQEHLKNLRAEEAEAKKLLTQEEALNRSYKDREEAINFVRDSYQEFDNALEEQNRILKELSAGFGLVDKSTNDAARALQKVEEESSKVSRRLDETYQAMLEASDPTIRKIYQEQIKWLSDYSAALTDLILVKGFRSVAYEIDSYNELLKVQAEGQQVVADLTKEIADAENYNISTREKLTKTTTDLLARVRELAKEGRDQNGVFAESADALEKLLQKYTKLVPLVERLTAADRALADSLKLLSKAPEMDPFQESLLALRAAATELQKTLTPPTGRSAEYATPGEAEKAAEREYSAAEKAYFDVANKLAAAQAQKDQLLREIAEAGGMGDQRAVKELQDTLKASKERIAQLEKEVEPLQKTYELRKENYEKLKQEREEKQKQLKLEEDMYAAGQERLTLIDAHIERLKQSRREQIAALAGDMSAQQLELERNFKMVFEGWDQSVAESIADFYKSNAEELRRMLLADYRLLEYAQNEAQRRLAEIEADLKVVPEGTERRQALLEEKSRLEALVDPKFISYLQGEIDSIEQQLEVVFGKWKNANEAAKAVADRIAAEQQRQEAWATLKPLLTPRGQEVFLSKLEVQGRFAQLLGLGDVQTTAQDAIQELKQTIMSFVTSTLQAAERTTWLSLSREERMRTVMDVLQGRRSMGTDVNAAIRESFNRNMGDLGKTVDEITAKLHLGLLPAIKDWSELFTAIDTLNIENSLKEELKNLLTFLKLLEDGIKGAWQGISQAVRKMTSHISKFNQPAADWINKFQDIMDMFQDTTFQKEIIDGFQAIGKDIEKLFGGSKYERDLAWYAGKFGQAYAGYAVFGQGTAGPESVNAIGAAAGIAAALGASWALPIAMGAQLIGQIFPGQTKNEEDQALRDRINEYNKTLKEWHAQFRSANVEFVKDSGFLGWRELFGNEIWTTLNKEAAERGAKLAEELIQGMQSTFQALSGPLADVIKGALDLSGWTASVGEQLQTALMNAILQASPVADQMKALSAMVQEAFLEQVTTTTEVIDEKAFKRMERYGLLDSKAWRMWGRVYDELTEEQQKAVLRELNVLKTVSQTELKPVPEGLTQEEIDAIRKQAEEIYKNAQAYSDLVKQISEDFDLAAETAARAQEAFDRLKSSIESAISSALTGDYDLQGFRAAIGRAIQQAVIDAALAAGPIAAGLQQLTKQISDALVGGLTVSEMDAIIAAANDLYNSLSPTQELIKLIAEKFGVMADGAERTAGALRNVPQGFKIMLERWSATVGIPYSAYSVGMPNIPRMASGGIVTRPTLALVGEAGPEAVVPLAASGAAIHIHFEGPVYGMSDFNRAVESAISQAERRKGLRDRGLGVSR